MANPYEFLEEDDDDIKIAGRKDFNIEAVIHAQINRIMYLGAMRSSLRPEIKQIERAINFFEYGLRPYWDSSAIFTGKSKKKIKNEYEQERKKILDERKDINIYKDPDAYFDNLTRHFSLIMCLLDKYNLGLKRVKDDYI